MPVRLTLIEIENRLKLRGISLISKDIKYENKYTPIVVRCDKHPRECIPTNWKSVSKNNPCKKCSGTGRGEKLKALARTKCKVEQAKKEFEERGFFMKGDYVNVNTPIEFRCPEHPTYPNKISLENLRKSTYACRPCRNKGIAASKRTEFSVIESYFLEKGYILKIQPHEYIDGKQKLPFVCPRHPDYPNAMPFEAVKYHDQGCVQCWEERRGSDLRMDFAVVKQSFLERDYELLVTEEEYRNNKQYLPYRCPIHPEYPNKISVNSLMNKQGCKPCGDARVRDAHRLPYSFVKEVLLKEGYELLTTNYQNNSQQLWYRCPNGHKRPTTFRNFYYNHSRCKKCDNVGRRGENNLAWKGGVTELNRYLRGYLFDWKQKWLSKFDYQCYLTQRNHTDLHVHHLTTPYHKIRDEVLAELSLTIQPQIGNYTTEELHQLKELFILKHEEIKGIPLRKEIHDLFHQLYGDEAGEKDFYEFAIRYKKGELTTAMSNA